MKKFLSNAIVVIVAYTIGTALGIMFLIRKRMGWIRVINPENFPKVNSESRLVIVSNHSDLCDYMIEVFLVPALLFPQHFLHPLRCTPWFTPDKRNFTDKWYWAWLRPRAIPIMRRKKNDNGDGEANNNGAGEVRKMLQIIAETAVIVLFPEGGRTRNGSTFFYNPSGTRRIRPLNKSTGWLVAKTKATVLTVWTEDVSWFKPPTKKLFSHLRWRRKITVKIGKPMQFSDNMGDMGSSKLTEVIQSNLLKLADQE